MTNQSVPRGNSKDAIGNDSAEAAVGVKYETGKAQNRKNIVCRLGKWLVVFESQHHQCVIKYNVC